MKYIFLSRAFFIDFPISKFPELEQKQDRPYIHVSIEISNNMFCVPLRSNINHSYAYFTDKATKCGIDFLKVVVINDTKYIDNAVPQIRQHEFNFLKGKEHIIKSKLIKYINNYKSAKLNLQIYRNQNIVKNSTLQYFEKFI